MKDLQKRHGLAAAKAVASQWGSACEPSAPSVLSHTLRAAFVVRVSSSTARAATVVQRAGGMCNGPLWGRSSRVCVPSLVQSLAGAGVCMRVTSADGFQLVVGRMGKGRSRAKVPKKKARGRERGWSL